MACSRRFLRNVEEVLTISTTISMGDSRVSECAGTTDGRYGPLLTICVPVRQQACQRTMSGHSKPPAVVDNDHIQPSSLREFRGQTYSRAAANDGMARIDLTPKLLEDFLSVGWWRHDSRFC